jgi:K+-sensing histidine kinase KdpD
MPEIVVGDEIRLKQVLYMGFDKDAGKLRTHIVDNGKGIKKEDEDKLFKMFGKLKRTAEINSEGLGMGLMIC